MSPSSSYPRTLPKTKSSQIRAMPRSSLKAPRPITARPTNRHDPWPRRTLRAPRRARLTMPTPPPVLTTSRFLNPPRRTRRSGTVEREVLIPALFVFFDQAVDELIGKLVIGQNHVEHLLPGLIRLFGRRFNATARGIFVVVFVGLAGKVHAHVREEARAWRLFAVGSWLPGSRVDTFG